METKQKGVAIINKVDDQEVRKYGGREWCKKKDRDDLHCIRQTQGGIIYVTGLRRRTIQNDI